MVSELILECCSLPRMFSSCFVFIELTVHTILSEFINEVREVNFNIFRKSAETSSSSGSRLQQFEFTPDPTEDSDKRSDERPKRTG